MTNQYMNNLYRDLLSNSPQTITIDIPADMGTGQIAQIVTKQGAVVSDWRMNYFSDMNVQGVSSEEYIQMLFCFNDGVSWNIADNRQSASIQKGESCIYRGHGKMEYLCYSKKSDFFFKNVKIPLSYFYKILNDYFETGEIEVYQKKVVGRHIKSEYYSLYGTHFCGAERLHAISRWTGISVSGKQSLGTAVSIFERGP